MIFRYARFVAGDSEAVSKEYASVFRSLVSVLQLEPATDPTMVPLRMPPKKANGITYQRQHCVFLEYVLPSQIVCHQ